MHDADLTAIQLDALREIGNVGAGNAATTLSDLLDKTVMIDIPRVKPLSFEETNPGDLPCQAADTHIAVYSRIEGELKGGTLVLFSKKDSFLLSDALLKKNSQGTHQPLTPIDISALAESAYIFCCSYASAVADLLSLSRKVNPVIPQLAVEGDCKMDSALIKKFSGGLTSAISIENIVTVEEAKRSGSDCLSAKDKEVSCASRINLSVVFLLETESAKKALEILGL